MDDILRQKIITKLTIYLNRPPTEIEIMNGETDTILMGWIRDDNAAAISQKVDIIAQATKVDISNINIK